MEKRAAMLATAAVLFGCAVPQPGSLNPSFPADPAEYLPFLAAGDAVITGQAFMRDMGGDVKVVPGSAVHLDPVTTYSRRWWALRGRSKEDFSVPAPDSLFVKARRETTVDQDGRFRFSGLAPGWYYVRSIVVWEPGGIWQAQGGVVGDSVLARAGRAVDVRLTR